MNKFINLLSFLLIINLLILGNLLIKQQNTSNLLPISYAETAKHNNDNYNLIVSILKDTNKNNLIQYANYFELNISENIPNMPKNNVAFTLSLPEQVSFIAIYNKVDSNNYKFECFIDNLFFVDNFYFSNNFLIVEHTDKNTSNDFSERKLFEIFIKENNTFKSIFRKNTYSEKLLSINKNNLKEIKNASIDYIPGNLPKVLCIITTTVYKCELSNLNNEESFEKIKELTKKEVYSFNSSSNTFKLSNDELIK